MIIPFALTVLLFLAIVQLGVVLSATLGPKIPLENPSGIQLPKVEKALSLNPLSAVRFLPGFGAIAPARLQNLMIQYVAAPAVTSTSYLFLVLVNSLVFLKQRFKILYTGVFYSFFVNFVLQCDFRFFPIVLLCLRFRFLRRQLPLLLNPFVLTFMYVVWSLYHPYGDFYYSFTDANGIVSYFSVPNSNSHMFYFLFTYFLNYLFLIVCIFTPNRYMDPVPPQETYSRWGFALFQSTKEVLQLFNPYYNYIVNIRLPWFEIALLIVSFNFLCICVTLATIPCYFIYLLSPTFALLLYITLWWGIFKLQRIHYDTLMLITIIYVQNQSRGPRSSLRSKHKSRSPHRSTDRENLYENINFEPQSLCENLDTIAAGMGVDRRLLNQIISLSESVIFLGLQLSDASSRKMQMVAVGTFVKSINGGESLTIELMSLLDKIFSEPEFETQGFMDFVNMGKGAQSKVKDIADSPGSQKIYKFFMYAMSLGLFSRAGLTLSKAGYSRMEEASIKRKHSSCVGFVDTLLDMSLFICTAGYQAYQGMSIDHIIHSPTTYVQFYDDVDVFCQDFERYKSTNVGAGVDHTQFLGRLSSLLQTYREIEIILPQLTRVDKTTMLKVRARLLNAEAILKNEAICQATRPSPFSLLLVGESGVGKSLLSDIFFAQFGKLRDLDTASDKKYTRSPSQEFWDNFDPKMWCLVLDDIGWQHPKVGTIDQSVSELLHLINNVPYVTNQASLEKKGTTPFLGHFVIGSTNTRDLNAASYFSYPAAARRRFPFIVDVTVKPEFCNEFGNLIGYPKPKKGEPDPYKDKFPDFWDFSVKEVFALDRKVIEREVFSSDAIGPMLLWFNTKVDEFYAKQGKALSSVDMVIKAKLCDTCRVPDPVCTCYQGVDFDPQGLLSTVCVFSFGGILGFIANVFLSAMLPTVIAKFAYLIVTRRLESAWSSTKSLWYSRFGNARDSMYEMGRRAQLNVVKTPRMLLLFGAILATGLVFKKLSSSAHAQSEVTPLTKEREDYFYSEKIELTTFDSPLNARCMDLQSLQNRVSRNVAYAEISTATMESKCRLLGIGGDLYLANNHCVPLFPERADIKLSSDRNGVCQSLSIRFSENDVSRDPDNDLCIVRLTGAPPRKDLKEYFLNKRPTGECEGVYLNRTISGELDVIKASRVTFKSQFLADLNVTLYAAMSTLVVPSVAGDCGMPLLATCGNGKAILGIHSMGAQSGWKFHAGTTVVTHDMLLQMCSKFPSECISVNDPVLSSQSAPRTLGTLSARSPLRYLESGVATIYGSFIGFRPTPKSNVCDSVLRAPLLKRGISTKMCKPVMSGYRPWRLGLLDMVNPVTEMDTDGIRECGDSYLQHVLSNVPDDAMKKILKPCDEFTALNGADGIAFMDSIKKSTSAGAPFNKSKKHFLLKEEPQRGLFDPIKLNDEMSARVKHIRSLYSKGIAYRPVFTAHLKDEAVSAKKAAIGKTRIFCGAPFDWSVVVRELFLGHVRLIQNYKFDFECGVGTVAPSTEWTDMYNHITKHGSDRIVAGDYKSYDKRMPPGLILEAFRILIVLASRSGNYTDEQITSMWCVAYDTAYPMVDFNGDLIGFWGSNPSGHPLTVIINGIANSLYMRYTFRSIGYSVMDFSKYVSLMTYGDDNIMSVSVDCPNFNHTSIQEALSKIGVVYTMADKEAESIPYIKIEEASFLKRGWLWDEIQNVYLAPLDEASIHKMLCVVVRSKVITPNEQICEIIRSAQREWWHYGQEEFKLKTQLLTEIISEVGLEEHFEDVPLLTYEYLWDQFHECSRKTCSTL